MKEKEITIQVLIRLKKESYKYFTEEEALKAVKQEGNALRYVKNQTEQICLEAVKQEGNALRYVKNQTEQICLEAVKQNDNALHYFDETLFVEEPESEIKELTIEELESILGYNIKIVK